MKFALFTIQGDSLPIAKRLLDDGNDVYIGQVSEWSKTGNHKKENDEQKKRRLKLFNGIIKKYDADKLVEALLKEKKPDDWFVFCDFNYLYPYADKLRGKFKGLLPTKEDYQLEKDRKYAKQIVEDLYPDLAVAEYTEFKTIDEGITFLEENTDTLYVLKGNSEDAKTIVPQSNEPEINHAKLINALQSNKKDYEAEGFLLEEKIPDLVEFTPEAISFNGKVLGVNVAIELKDIAAGDVGFQTGCTADVCYWQSLDSYVYQNFLEPLAEKMMRPNELVFWDAAIAWSPSREQFFFLEFCGNRPGYDTIFTELATFDRATDFFEALVAEKPLNKIAYPIGASVRVFNFVADDKFPEMYEGHSWIYCQPVKDIWLWDAFSEDDQYYTVGSGFDLAILTGRGHLIEEAALSSYAHWDKDFMFDDGVFRPYEDFMSFAYPTSIPNRVNVLVDEGILEATLIDEDKYRGTDELKRDMQGKMDEAMKGKDKEIGGLKKKYDSDLEAIKNQVAEALNE